MSWTRYVAIGDSFTEGLEEPGPMNRHRGWADRLAESLAQRDVSVEYANLAIRGRCLPQIIHEQLPVAIAMQPDLISIAGGVNDVLRPRWSLDQAAELIHTGVISAQASGADVLLVVFGDASRRSRTLGTVTSRLQQYREILLGVAHEQQCYVVDFWAETVFDDPRFWADDRLHFGPLGHERVALAAEEALGLGTSPWREPLPARTRPTFGQTLRSDVVWTGQHLAPWFGRRLQRKSSGDQVAAKRPRLQPVLSQLTSADAPADMHTGPRSADRPDATARTAAPPLRRRG